MSMFTTVIPTAGPNGNIWAILGHARQLMKRLKVEQSEIDALTLSVKGARSYEAACAAVREWFPLEGDE